MPGNDTNELLQVQQFVGEKGLLADNGQSLRSRGTRYNEKAMVPYGGSMLDAACDEGTLYVATNPTPGTAVAYALQTTFSPTAGLFAVYNKNKNRSVFLDYLKLMLTVAPTATVSMEFAVKLDSTNRAPTAGNATIVPVNPNGNVTDDGGIVVAAFNAAALTLPAEPSSPAPRLVARSRIPTSLGIIGDEYLLQFGSAEPAALAIPGLTAARATAVGRFTGHANKVGIPPGWWGLIYMWWLTAATTAPSFEYELGFKVR